MNQLTIDRGEINLWNPNRIKPMSKNLLLNEFVKSINSGNDSAVKQMKPTNIIALDFSMNSTEYAVVEAGTNRISLIKKDTIKAKDGNPTGTG